MLKDRLEQMKAASAEKIPAETQAIMQRAKQNLAASGIMEQAIKAGATLTDFNLLDAEGQTVSLAALRAQGPVMITIYRGVW